MCPCQVTCSPLQVSIFRRVSSEGATEESMCLTEEIDGGRFSGGLSWQVPTGCKDGRVSQASDVNNLPAPTDSGDVQKQKFTAKGLNTQDLITLVVCGHEDIRGTATCQFFSNRLYNFIANGLDPSIDPSFVPQLQAFCPQNSGGSNRVPLDTGSQLKFDTSYYANLRNGREILESDEALWNDASTNMFVQKYLGLRGMLGLSFSLEFGNSMVKMGNIGIKTGADGEFVRFALFCF
ncbi:cationic peroxidase 2-like [Arachis ipaensis]|uniref:cationic peroxidase 2-like n=1 Tax=Arachis ipaensis TaxID=130454 RepID=UPI000A2B2693|nr:cationic peroxidase 2-like [Arachis ipaensis]